MALRSSSRRAWFRCSSAARETTRSSSSRRGLFETGDLDGEGAAALDQRRVRRFRLRGDARLVAGRLAGLEELPLRRRQLLVGRALLGLDPLDRLPRFFLALFLRAQLFLGRPALDGNLILLALDPLGRVAGSRHLQVEADDGLLLPVQFSLHRSDRRLGGGDGDVER